MKTPEQISQEIIQEMADYMASPGAISEFVGYLDCKARIIAAIAERDKRAAALAEALRVFLHRHADDGRTSQYRDARDQARAALAAYDAEAK